MSTRSCATLVCTAVFVASLVSGSDDGLGSTDAGTTTAASSTSEGTTAAAVVTADAAARGPLLHPGLSDRVAARLGDSRSAAAPPGQSAVPGAVREPWRRWGGEARQQLVLPRRRQRGEKVLPRQPRCSRESWEPGGPSVPELRPPVRSAGRDHPDSRSLALRRPDRVSRRFPGAGRHLHHQDGDGELSALLMRMDSTPSRAGGDASTDQVSGLPRVRRGERGRL